MATATLNTNLDFAAGAVNNDATHWTLWSAASGGSLLWTDTLDNNPDPLEANQFYRIPSAMLTLEVAMGADGATAEMARRAVAGMVTGTVYLQLHDGAPGNAGTQNVVTDTRIGIQAANWTVAA